MKDEYIDVFDEKMNLIGCQERSEVHKNGFWHQTFHCWIVQKTASKNYVIFQIRQKDKYIFPGLYDVSCGGHLLEGEGAQDGIREMEEKLGIRVNFEELIYLGISKSEHKGKDYIDREFNNVYLYITERNLKDFTIDINESRGIIRVPIYDIVDLFHNRVESINIEGYICEKNNDFIEINSIAYKKDFLPFSNEYLTKTFDKFTKIIK